MGDRIDDDYGRELRQEARAERQADLKAAGNLLNPQQQKDLQTFLTQNCWLKPAEAQDVMDTINSLAADVGAKTPGSWAGPKLADQVLQVVRDSLEGHVPQKFLNNKDNFTPVTGMLTQAVEAREARIEASHQPGGVATAVSAPKAPGR